MLPDHARFVHFNTRETVIICLFTGPSGLANASWQNDITDFSLCLEYRGHQERLQEGSTAYFPLSGRFLYVFAGFVLVSDGPIMRDLCN